MRALVQVLPHLSLGRPHKPGRVRLQARAFVRLRTPGGAAAHVRRSVGARILCVCVHHHSVMLYYKIFQITTVRLLIFLKRTSLLPQENAPGRFV